MKKLSVLIIIVFSVSLILIIGGCSSSTDPDFMMPVKITAALDHSNVVETNVTRVELTLSAEDIGSTTIEVPLVNGRLEYEMQVQPGQDRLIQLDAYDEDSLLLYTGSETVDVGLGEEVVVNIHLEPQVLMIKVDPLYQRVNPDLDVTTSFNVYVYNVEDLFGASFRINFDSSVIAPYDIEYHNFLGNDLLTLSKFEKNYVAVGMTNKRGGGTVNGSGLLATIYFDHVAEGNTSLEIDTATISLLGTTGFPIGNFNNLVIENGSVVVESSSGGN